MQVGRSPIPVNIALLVNHTATVIQLQGLNKIGLAKRMLERWLFVVIKN